MHNYFGNTEKNFFSTFGSVCTIINKILTIAVVLNSKKSYWVQSPDFHDLKIFSNELIKTIGEINTMVKCNDWASKNANVRVVRVVENDHRPIIGRILFAQFGFSLTQSKQVQNINPNQCLIKKQIALDFPGQISKIGKSHKHTVKTTVNKRFTPSHQKGRRVPIKLQPLVNAELKKMLD